MSMWLLILMLLLVFLALDRVIIPILQMRVKPDASAIGRISTISALSYLRTAALVMTLSATGMFAFLAFLINRSNGLDASEFEQIREMLQQWQARFAWFSPLWAAFVGTAVLVAMATIAYRRAKLRLEDVHKKIIEREIERLKSQREAGLWEELPPTTDMESVAQAVMEADEQYRALGDGSEWKRQRHKDRIGELLSLYYQLDIARRLKVDFSPDDLAMPRPRTFSARVQTFFFSQGWLQSLRGATGGLAIVSLALLPVCLIGIQAPQANAELTARLNSINQLVIEYNNEHKLTTTRAQAESAWNAVKDAESTEEVEVSAEDQEIIEDIARAYERELVESDLGSGLPRFEQRQAYELSSHDARDTILRQAAERAPSERVRRPSLEDAPGLSEPQKELVKEYRAANTGELHTEAGRAMKADLAEVARTKPRMWQTMKSKAVAWMGKFQTPAPDASWRAFGLQRALDGMESAKHDKTFSDIEGARRAETLRGLSDEAMPVESAFKAARESVDSALQPYNALKESINTLSHRNVHIQDTIVEVMPIVEQYPAAIDAPPEKQVNAGRVRESGDELASVLDKNHPLKSDIAFNPKDLDRADIHRISELRRQAQAHILYDDHFPSQLGAEIRTEIGQLNERLAPWTDPRRPPPDSPDAPPSRPGGGNGGGGGGLSGGGRRAPSRSMTSFTRSRSFGRLRGFSRIGGVLIGRSLQEESEASASQSIIEVRDLQWEIRDDKVRLTLVDGAGEKHSSPWHDRMLVEQALAYAADGRPTTVTMVTTEAISELRILLHPVLVDTQLGRSAIDLDRLVDKYTGDQDFRRDFEESVRFQADLYRYAWAQRILTLEPLQCFDGDLQSHVALARTLASDMEKRAAEEEGFAQQFGKHTGDLLRDARRSIVAAKKGKQFDPVLVNWMCESAGAKDLAEFGKSIQHETKLAFSRGPTPNLQYGNILLDRPGRPIATASTKVYDDACAFYRAHPDVVKDFYARVERFNAKVRLGTANELERRELDQMQVRINKYEAALRPMLNGVIFMPPTFVVWSGVRERKFSPNVVSLLVPEQQAPLDQLEFMLQVAFTSPPYFQAEINSREDVEKLENASDTDPWQFPAIAAEIQQTVTDQLSADERALVQQMNEFAILQRFFRLAFGGELGGVFPVRKLAELHRAVAQGEKQPFSRTLRWNVRPGQLERSLWQSWLLLNAGQKPKENVEATPKDNAIADILSLLEEPSARRTKFSEELAAIRPGDKATNEDRAAAQTKFDSALDAFNRQQIDWEERFAAAVKKLQQDFFSDNPKAREIEFLAAGVTMLQIRRDLALHLDERQVLTEQSLAGK